MNTPTSEGPLAAAALDYAERGWPVLPLHTATDEQCSCGRADCSSPGKHPRTPHGLKDASTDPPMIRGWWRSWPTANVGILTGAESGIVALDVDTRHDGHESLAELIRQHGELQATVEAATGGGGRHLIYRHPGGKVGNRTNVRPGIDVRGDGGYIVAPPSAHASGRRYCWAAGSGPDKREPAELPGWLHEMLTRPEPAPRPAARNGDASARLLQDAARYAANAAGATEGGRNQAAFSLAGHLAAFVGDSGERLTECQIFDILRPWNGRNAPPLAEAELLAAVRSAMTNGTPRAPHEVRAAPRPAPAGADSSPASAPILVRLADVEPREVQWLWPGRIPLGRISLLVGRPGEGKSFVTIDMAARVTTGTPWPDGSSCPSGSVILISAEDDPADTIRPRLDAHLADVSRVHLLSAVRRFDDDGQPCEIMFALDDARALEAALQALPDCKLIVVDPIGSFLGGRVDAHRDNEVRSVLAPVGRLAEKYGAAVVVVAHRRKSAGSIADDLALGSRAFSGIARAVWHLSRDAQDKGRRLLLPGKNNLAPEGTGLAFRLLGEPAAIAWEADPIEMSADDGLAAENAAGRDGRPGPEPEARNVAAVWLRGLLADGPIEVAQARDEAKAAGIKWRTVERAKDELGVMSRRRQFGGGWTWELSCRQDARQEQNNLATWRDRADGPENADSEPEIFELAKMNYLGELGGDSRERGEL